MKKILKMFMALTVMFVSLLLFTNTSYASETYTIKSGDSLSKIAKTHYGDASKWKDIFEANKSIIKNPNLIYPGWALILPDTPPKEEKKPAKVVKEVSRAKGRQDDSFIFKATAYDLSIESCGKSLNHPAYGVTYSGKSVKNKTRIEASCVAVDPRKIPLGSLISVIFEEPYYQRYNGIYQALDIGGGVKGNHVDIFLGDFKSKKTSKEVQRFGVTKVKVVVLREGW